MENKINRLFVYGSLRSGFHHPAYEYISKYFHLLSDAKVKGKLYDLGSYPAAIPGSEEHYIIGELYELKKPADFAWAIEQLDAYEGVDPEEGEIQLYRREITDVEYGDQNTKAWIYWYNGTITDEPFIQSGDVLDFLKHKSKI